MITFLENLAKAVVGTQTVVLVTLPIDFKLTKDEKTGLEKEDYAYEEAYKDEATIAHRAIGRVVSKIDVPLTVSDVVEVIKKRTFEKINSATAVETQRKYVSTYSENPEIFERQAVSEALKIADYYPYHPSYISTLYEIVTRSPELQRTRDALRITREVTRTLWRSGEDPELIMPWHIDLASPNIRGRLITATYRGYNAALNKDIVTEKGEKGRVSLTSKPELAYVAATTIFLETFTYGDVLIAAPPFPTKQDIALATYEKAFFEKNDYKLTDIIDTLEEMRNTLIHLQERDNKYWFTTFPSVIDAIERKAREITNREAYPELKGLVNKILVADIDIVAGAQRRVRRREEELKPKIYMENLCVIATPDEQPILKGIQNYTLLVLLRKPSDEELSELIFTEDGRTRTYRNTITVLYPSDENLVSRLLTEVKRYKAASKIIEELEQLYVDETIREIQKKRADNYIRTKYGEILRRSLSALDTVAFPKYDSEKKMDTVGVSKVSPSRSIISQAELTLQDRSIAKIPPDYKMTFDGLDFLLGERLGINLKEGDREISVNDLLGYFLTNPKLPIVTFDMLRPTLREGVRNLDIAVRSVKEGRIYWKKVYKGDEKPSGVEQGDEPTFIDQGDTIIPWRLAAREFAEGLLKKEGIFEEEGVKKRVWHVVLVEDTERRLSDLVKQARYEDPLRTCPVIERVESIREEFDIILSPEYIRTMPSESAEASVSVEPIGVFKYNVTLKVDKGEIEPEKEKPPYSAKWKLTTPKSPGVYHFTLTASAEDPKKTKITRTLRVEVLKKVGVEIVETLENDHIGRLIVKIETADYNSFSNLMSVIEPKLKSKSSLVDGTAKIFSATSTVEFNAQSTDHAVFQHLIKEAVDTMGGKVRDFAVSTRIEEGLQVDEVLVIACRDIKNVKYHLLK
jgi:predicted AAA+ superfamily ATPase